ncbi:MAG: hypothetical protein BJ554DRAFT_1736, partial [Olpidium bornovanus]
MNSLLQEALMNTKHVSQAAIIRRKDGLVKAKSPNFQLGPNELAKVVNIFDNPTSVREDGGAVLVMDTPYKAVRCDQLSIYAKNVG